MNDDGLVRIRRVCMHDGLMRPTSCLDSVGLALLLQYFIIPAPPPLLRPHSTESTVPEISTQPVCTCVCKLKTGWGMSQIVQDTFKHAHTCTQSHTCTHIQTHTRTNIPAKNTHTPICAQTHTHTDYVCWFPHGDISTGGCDAAAALRMILHNV